MMDAVSKQAAQIILGHLQENQPLIVAIDGRCGSGKTTLAAHLQKTLGCTVFHMDDYFLRLEQRTAERLNTAGGNVDYERFSSEILLPLRSGAASITYRPFDCNTKSLKPPVTVLSCAINVVEGSYSCHPTLWDHYDLRIFLTVSPEEQLRRIRVRNGDAKLVQFQEKWIPMEERYFSAFQIRERCDFCIETT